jgi:flagellar biosynthetic protein FliR
MLVTVLVAPPAGASVSPYSLPGVILIVQQVAIGVTLGFVVQMAFAAVELAGDLIGLQMGLSFASFVDPQRGEPAPIVGSFLGVAAMLLFFAIDGHLALIGALAETFRTLPVHAVAWPWLAWHELATAGALVFAAGLQIALPVLAALILVNVALSVLTRAAPQLNLFAVGFPVTLLAGMLVLLLALPRLLPLVEGALRQALTLAR